MNDEYIPGACHLCDENIMIKWKNIYWNGSEGLWVCQKCENKIVNFVRELSRNKLQRKKQEIGKLILENKKKARGEIK